MTKFRFQKKTGGHWDWCADCGYRFEIGDTIDMSSEDNVSRCVSCIKKIEKDKEK